MIIRQATPTEGPDLSTQGLLGIRHRPARRAERGGPDATTMSTRLQQSSRRTGKTVCDAAASTAHSLLADFSRKA